MLFYHKTQPIGFQEYFLKQGVFLKSRWVLFAFFRRFLRARFSITLAELEYGIKKSQNQNQNKIALTEFVAPLEIEPFEIEAAITFGDIRAQLEKKGTVIGAYDILIAAHALSLNLVLVTNNTKEFIRIPSLQVENWV